GLGEGVYLSEEGQRSSSAGGSSAKSHAGVPASHGSPEACAASGVGSVVTGSSGAVNVNFFFGFFPLRSGLNPLIVPPPRLSAGLRCVLPGSGSHGSSTRRCAYS